MASISGASSRTYLTWYSPICSQSLRSSWAGWPCLALRSPSPPWRSASGAGGTCPGAPPSPGPASLGSRRGWAAASPRIRPPAIKEGSSEQIFTSKRSFCMLSRHEIIYNFLIHKSNPYMPFLNFRKKISLLFLRFSPEFRCSNISGVTELFFQKLHFGPIR